jgi:hypothetical protein
LPHRKLESHALAIISQADLLSNAGNSGQLQAFSADINSVIKPGNIRPANPCQRRMRVFVK